MCRHQRSRGCLDKQRELGLDPQPVVYSCECGFNSTIKEKLKIHKYKCEFKQSSFIPGSQITNINNTNTINTTNNFLQQNIILDKQTTELFLQRVKDSLSSNHLCELAEKGYIELSDQVITTSIRNANGCSDIRVADPSRKKLIVKTASGRLEEDRGGTVTGALIGETVDKVLSLSHQESTDPAKILNTMKVSKDDKDKGRPLLLDCVFNKCPRTFNQTVQIHAPPSPSSGSAYIERVLKEEDEKNTKKKANRAQKWLKYLNANKMYDAENMRFWNDRTELVWIESLDGKISLIGKNVKYEGTLIKFNSKDFALINSMGLDAYVAKNCRNIEEDDLSDPESDPEPKLSIEEQWYSSFMSRAYSAPNGLTINKRMKLLVRLEPNRGFTIMGRPNEWSGDPTTLTDEQVETLKNAGVKDHIHPDAITKRYDHSSGVVTAADTIYYTSQMEFMPPVTPSNNVTTPNSIENSAKTLPGSLISTINNGLKVNPTPKISEKLKESYELEPYLKFFDNSKRLDDGRWICMLREFNNLVFKPVSIVGYDRSSYVDSQTRLKSYRHFDFSGSAMRGVDKIEPLNDADKQIISDLCLNHVPSKIRIKNL